jgi:hypothetical protein
MHACIGLQSLGIYAFLSPSFVWPLQASGLGKGPGMVSIDLLLLVQHTVRTA